MIEIKIKASIKRTFVECAFSMGIALTLLGLANEVITEGIWHDISLLISGVMLGVFCFYFTLLSNLIEAKRSKNLPQKET